MNTREEKGVTLVALVITIIILLILATIGVTAGNSALDYATYSNFKEELIILQTQVNELNQNNENNIGQELTNDQKQILNIETISNIIYKNKTNEEKTEIENSFRYCSQSYINRNFENIKVNRDYLISVKYRYVICSEGIEYKGVTYYMVNQMDDGLYNVNYTDKNVQTGTFEVSCTDENDRWRIDVFNIQSNGYIDNWQIQYRKAENTEWKTANTSTFYVTKDGNYYVRVIHGDINLGSKLVTAIREDTENNI